MFADLFIIVVCTIFTYTIAVLYYFGMTKLTDGKYPVITYVVTFIFGITFLFLLRFFVEFLI
jgi:hypothetical protein